MFTAFFGLIRQPFTTEIPAEALFRSPPLEAYRSHENSC